MVFQRFAVAAGARSRCRPDSDAGCRLPVVVAAQAAQRTRIRFQADAATGAAVRPGCSVTRCAGLRRVRAIPLAIHRILVRRAGGKSTRRRPEPRARDFGQHAERIAAQGRNDDAGSVGARDTAPAGDAEYLARTGGRERSDALAHRWFGDRIFKRRFDQPRARTAVAVRSSQGSHAATVQRDRSARRRRPAVARAGPRQRCDRGDIAVATDSAGAAGPGARRPDRAGDLPRLPGIVAVAARVETLVCLDAHAVAAVGAAFRASAGHPVQRPLVSAAGRAGRRHTCRCARRFQPASYGKVPR